MSNMSEDDDPSSNENTSSPDRQPETSRRNFEKPGDSWSGADKNYLGVDFHSNERESRSYLFGNEDSKGDNDRFLGVDRNLYPRLYQIMLSSLFTRIAATVPLPRGGSEMIVFTIALVFAVMRTMYDVASFEAAVFGGKSIAEEMDSMRSSLTNPMGFQCFFGTVALGVPAKDAFSVGEQCAALDRMFRSLSDRGAGAGFRLVDNVKASGKLGISSGPRNSQKYFIP